MSTNKYREKLKINWWEHMPVIGTMAYIIRFEFFLNDQTLNTSNGKEIRKGVKKFRNLYSLFFMLFGTPIGASFLITRWSTGDWIWPLLWIAIASICIQNISPILYRNFYLKGLDQLDKIEAI